MVCPASEDSPAGALIVSRISPDVALLFGHRRREVALVLLERPGHKSVATLAGGASAPVRYHMRGLPGGRTHGRPPSTREPTD
jgi:hypothetical protein